MGCRVDEVRRVGVLGFVAGGLEEAGVQLGLIRHHLGRLGLLLWDGPANRCRCGADGACGLCGCRLR